MKKTIAEKILLSEKNYYFSYIIQKMSYIKIIFNRSKYVFLISGIPVMVCIAVIQFLTNNTCNQG